MKLIRNKKGMSLIYVISMMFVVMALTLMMLSAAMYNNTLANLTKSKFETKISLDQIGEDFVAGVDVADELYVTPYSLDVLEDGNKKEMEIKKSNKILLTVKTDGGIITAWIYGEE